MTTMSQSFDMLDLIKRFLQAKGWERVDQGRNNLLLYQGPVDDTNTPIILALPKSSHFSDAKLIMNQALNLLAELEDKTVQQLSEEIANLGCDFFRQRIISPCDAASLPLVDITRLLDNLTNIIKYAACMEKDNQPYFSKSKRIGSQIIEKCRFGQTFVGSFGISLEMPLPLPMTSNVKEIPFERKLMERIARGLITIQKAVKEGNSQILIDNYKNGFNANIYECFQKLLAFQPNCQVEFSFAWSIEYQPSEELKNVPKVLFSSQDSRPLLENAVKILRTSVESAVTQVQGRIVQLQADDSPSSDEAIERMENEIEKGSRFIVIDWELDNANHTLIRVCLTDTLYRQACDAHRDKKKVSIQGIPEKKGRFFYLTAPKNFKVVDDQ